MILPSFRWIAWIEGMNFYHEEAGGQAAGPTEKTKEAP